MVSLNPRGLLVFWLLAGESKQKTVAKIDNALTRTKKIIALTELPLHRVLTLQPPPFERQGRR